MIFQFFVILNQTIRIICYDTNWMMLRLTQYVWEWMKKCIKLLLAQFECQVSGLFRRHVCSNMCVMFNYVFYFILSNRRAIERFFQRLFSIPNFSA